MQQTDTNVCTACGACFAVCPKQAITMRAASDGCKYPEIDEAACIRCGKCAKVCADQSRLEKRMPCNTYAAFSCDSDLVENSASGGVYASLAMSCMRQGGMAAGAVLDCSNEDVQVYHILSDHVEDIGRMQGSKYVQSDAWRCYEEVIKALHSGKTVLFSGTPCQVSAVKSLSGDPDNLVTIDLVCHGVPPVRMLKEFVRVLEKRFGGMVDNLLFRDKSCKKSFCSRLDIKKWGRTRSYFMQSHHMSFYKYFLESVIYRENCYTCPHAHLERISDLTIGDYWGIEKFHGEDIVSGRMPRGKNWSCILVNTEKGQRFLKKHEHMLRLYPSKPEWVAQTNRQLNEPSRKPEKREQVLKRYLSGGYSAVETDFIRENGGWIRYYWRTAKNLRRNKKLHDINGKS